MNKTLAWLLFVCIAAAAVESAVYLIPHRADPYAVVQPCGENAGWIEKKPGHIVCTLKNGQVINLRSAKQ